MNSSHIHLKESFWIQFIWLISLISCYFIIDWICAILIVVFIDIYQDGFCHLVESTYLKWRNKIIECLWKLKIDICWGISFNTNINSLMNIHIFSNESRFSLWISSRKFQLLLQIKERWFAFFKITSFPKKISFSAEIYYHLFLKLFWQQLALRNI